MCWKVITVGGRGDVITVINGRGKLLQVVGGGIMEVRYDWC